MRPILDVEDIPMADQQNHTANTSMALEPFIVPVCFVLLFCSIAVAYVAFFPQPDCVRDTLASCSFALVLLAYLVSRALSISDLRMRYDPKKSVAIVSSFAFVVICFSPALLSILGAWRRCQGSNFNSYFLYQIALGVVFAFFLLGLLGTIDVPKKSKTDETWTQKVVLPAALITLFISLGSPHFFDYLSGVMPGAAITYVLDARFLIAAAIAVLIVIDAFRLSEGWNVIRTRVQAITDKWLRIHDIDFTHEPGKAFVLSLANTFLGLARFVFQTTATVGFAAYEFLWALGTSLWKFLISGGALYGLVLSVTAYVAAYMTVNAREIADDVRRTLQGQSRPLQDYFFFFVFFYLGICLVHAMLSRSEPRRIVATLDSSAKIGGLAIFGTWVSSLLMHLVASISTFNILIRLNAPGFVGAESLGLFFLVTSAVAATGTAVAVVWSMRDSGASR
jgi:hypothetical protein